MKNCIECAKIMGKATCLVVFYLLVLGTVISSNAGELEKTPSDTVTVSQLASVTTTAIAGNLTFTPDIAGTTAKGGGNVTDQGSSAVIERGLCWNMTGNPTISDAKASDGSGTGIFTNVSMTALAADHVYYIRAYAINSQGTAYGNVVTFNSGKPFGTEYAGGFVFYNNGSGGGLVAAKKDQSTDQAWSNINNFAGCPNGKIGTPIADFADCPYGNGKIGKYCPYCGAGCLSLVIGITGTAIGTGLANTKAIVAQSDHKSSAAQLCLNYNDGTYSDWFLPSKDEINLMYRKLKVIGVGGFADNGYWSSSEKYASQAWLQHFYFHNQYYHPKHNTYCVRAVRAF